MHLSFGVVILCKLNVYDDRESGQKISHFHLHFNHSSFLLNLVVNLWMKYAFELFGNRSELGMNQSIIQLISSFVLQYHFFFIPSIILYYVCIRIITLLHSFFFFFENSNPNLCFHASVSISGFLFKFLSAWQYVFARNCNDAFDLLHFRNDQCV